MLRRALIDYVKLLGLIYLMLAFGTAVALAYKGVELLEGAQFKETVQQFAILAFPFALIGVVAERLERFLVGRVGSGHD